MKRILVSGGLLFIFVIGFILISEKSQFESELTRPYSNASSTSQFEQFPALMLPVLAESLGRGQKSYHVMENGDEIKAITHSQGIESVYHNQGVTFSRQNISISMRLSGAKNLSPVRVSPNKVEYKRDGLTEWYTNSPLGIEQGFTLQNNPTTQKGRYEVVIGIELDFDDGISVLQSPDKKAIRFVEHKSGKDVLRYSGLFAYDSTGKELPSEMELLDSRIEITVDDSEAQYPIVIDPFIEIQKIFASDVPPDAMFWQFGGTVHISGNTALVGAVGATVSGNAFAGQAYIFDRDPNTGLWSETQILSGSNSTGFGSQFGNCVHIDGDTAIIGASNIISGLQGEAYIFERDPMTNLWSEIDDFTGSTAGPGDFYGISCTVEESSGIAMVGANRAFAVEGRVYVYERDMANMWNEVQVLSPSGGMPGFEYGFKHNFQGNTAAVGAFGGDRVYIYERDMMGMWIEDDILTGSDTVAGDAFGVDVDFDGDNMVIGASEFNTDQGKAYIFERDPMTNMWSEVADFEATMPVPGEFFGSNVSISGDIAIVSASLLITTNGRVFVYEKDAMGMWPQVQEITASDGMAGDSFGVETSLDGHQLIVGAPGVDGAMGSFIGAAYLYGDDVTLDVNIIGTGSGTVISMPAGIDCGGMVNDCTEDYQYQTLVSLTAVPDVGSFFVGWSDDCSGVMEGTTILMLDDSLCTAEFAIIQVTLDVTIEGNGEGGVVSTNPGIDCNSTGTMDCDETYDFGTIVTLTATPEPLSYFVGWSGDAACTGDPTNPVLNLTMNMDISCIATFELLPVLDVIIQGNGTCTVTSEPPGIDCPDDCSEIIDPAGTTVTLTADPDPVSAFVDWTGDCDDENPTTSITVNQDSTCIATCVLTQFVLNPVFPAIDDNINFISAENASPGRNVAFAWSKATGNFTVGGQVCGGTQLGLKNPRLLAISRANDFGVATYIFYIPLLGDFEFQIQLQAVDIATCRTSNIVPQVIRKEEGG